MADEPADWDQRKIGSLAYTAEVLEFNEPGGMMDQYSTAIGNLIYLESEPEISIESMKPNLGPFVLGDSCEPKDTMGILQHCRDSRLEIVEKIKSQDPDFSLHEIELDEISRCNLNADETKLLSGTIQNRNILRQALPELKKADPDHEKIGRLLSEHHTILRDVLKVSTSKIETMLDAAMNAGALGGKINGSGGGGCMFTYAPHNPEEVVEAIIKSGGKAYTIHSEVGTRID
jgi:galactokinase